MILKFLALSLQHVSLTFSDEISLFRCHKKNRNSEILFTKSGFQVYNVTVSFDGRAPPGPGGGVCTLQHSRKLHSWILRGPTRKRENREGRKINLKRNFRREGGTEGEMEEREGKRGEGMEERGEEGKEGTEGSLHPLEFSKVGAYGYTVGYCSIFSGRWRVIRTSVVWWRQVIMTINESRQIRFVSLQRLYGASSCVHDVLACAMTGAFHTFHNVASYILFLV